MRIGLVLEGGGMRGLYSQGVIDAFLDAGIKVDGLVGVSAGALFGVNLLSKQRGRGLRYNKRFIGQKNYMSLWSWLTTGNFVNKDFTYYKVPLELDVFDEQTFEESGADFYAVATNVETGKPDYLPVKNVFKEMEIFRASSALPLASKIVEWQGKKYLDGGLSDSIPVEFARSLGFDKLIVVLTRPKDYRKRPSKGRIYQLFYRKYPNFVKVASQRWKTYNCQVEEVIKLEKAGEIFVVRPEKDLDIGRLETNPEKFDEIYNIGLTDTQKIMPKLKAYLK
ncbi:patatin-like phospholipase family protein [Streptococcus sobrinus]|uniref:patatin-like phospholipase family protein n=1 Tax=Streptococcus sobrinus TaxID=1310 RepID=UPI00030FF2B0|nr:patatin family protein [Streptococcus sobrinus]